MRQAESGAGLTGHGGRIDVADALYPRATRPWIDLSTGINPRPWRPDSGLAIDAGPLPTRAALAALEAAAAGHFGVAPARVAALPGSEAGLRLLRFVGLPEPLVRIAPGYATHGAVAAVTLAIAELDEQAERGGTILLANPNNPDGRTLAPQRIAAVADALARRGGWLVVDEAFADADADAALSILPVLPEAAPVVAFRSFGKFFGLAGLRLGFVVAPAGIVARFRALIGDWPVSAHAIAYGAAAYRDAAWIARTRAELPERAATLDALLARHGLAASGSCPLFRLVSDPRAPAVFDRLARAGILVRPFDHAPAWLRFGLPADAAAFARLDRALGDG